MSIELVMLSNHLILWCCLPLLVSIFPSIRVFSNESALCIRLLKSWSFSFIISSSNEYSGLISLKIDWFDLLVVQGRVFSSTTILKHQFFSVQPSLWSNSLSLLLYLKWHAFSWKTQKTLTSTIKFFYFEQLDGYFLPSLFSVFLSLKLRVQREVGHPTSHTHTSKEIWKDLVLVWLN